LFKLQQDLKRLPFRVNEVREAARRNRLGCSH
jgi:hypothetical protein